MEVYKHIVTLIFSRGIVHYLHAVKPYVLQVKHIIGGLLDAVEGCYDIWTDKKYLFSGLEEKVIPNPDGSRNTTEYEWKAAGYVSVDYTIDPSLDARCSRSRYVHIFSSYFHSPIRKSGFHP